MKMIVISGLFVAVLFACNILAANNFNGVGFWNDSTKWDYGVPLVEPEITGNGQHAVIYSEAVCTVAQSEPNAAESTYLHLGWAGDSTLNIISGGKLTGSNALFVGNPSAFAKGIMNISGGEANFPNVYAGRKGGADITIGNPGGTLNIDGNLYLAWQSDNYLPVDIEVAPGGLLNVGNNISYDGSGSGKKTINITGGTIIIDGGAGVDRTSTVEAMINLDILKAHGGRAEVLYDYDVTNADKTTITAGTYDPFIAWGVDPVGFIDELSPVITWQSGDVTQATDGHKIYFSTDEDLIISGDNSVLTVLSDPNFTPGRLDYGQTYYFRIEQVNAAYAESPWTTPVYTLEVQDHLIIDDMESYNTSDNPIYDTWAFSNTGAIATLGTGISVDQQSMWFQYNNDGSYGYSEAEYTFGEAIDFVADDLKSLGLVFWGDSQNNPDDMYISLTDTNGAVGTIYYDGDPCNLSNETWYAWDIALTQFSAKGIELNSISKVAIGLGQKGSVTPSGKSGSLYIDNIFLYPVRSASTPADISGNGLINFMDFFYLAEEWLQSPETITATAVASSPILYYNFDETSGSVAADSANIDASLDCDATTNDSSTNHWDTDGVINGCLSFDESFGLRMNCGGDLINTHISDELTISLWVKGDQLLQPLNKGFVFAGGAGSDVTLGFRCPDVPGANSDDTEVMWKVNFEFLRPDVDALDYESRWVHYALTYNYDGVNEGSYKVYKNGVLIGEDDISEVLLSIDSFAIGIRHNADNSQYAGKIDEFKIFNSELSQSEIVTLAGLSEVTQPFLHPVDIVKDDLVDADDLASIINEWLDEPVFP